MIKSLKNNTIIFCLIFCVIPVICFAEFGQKFTIDNYELHISATQLSNKLIVSGNVKYGEPSPLLKIYVYLSDDKGHSTSVKGTIKNYRMSGRFTIKKKYLNGGHWTVERVSVFK